MRALIQRVSRASVHTEGITVGSIGPGLLVLIGVGKGDTFVDSKYLAEKILNLRIFSDAEGKLNFSVKDRGYALLVVSQFTLFADCRSGRRPFFGDAAPPGIARELYQSFCEELKKSGLQVEEGVFQSHMQVELCNDGPVTIWIDSKEK